MELADNAMLRLIEIWIWIWPRPTNMRAALLRWSTRRFMKKLARRQERLESPEFLTWP